MIFLDNTTFDIVSEGSCAITIDSKNINDVRNRIRKSVVVENFLVVNFSCDDVRLLIFSSIASHEIMKDLLK